MSLAVVGSIAFDSIRTPFGEVERELGGSATYAAVAASRFTDVRVIGPVGDDFGFEHYELLEGSGAATEEMPRVPGGQTFFWRGRYEFDMSLAHTEETRLNVFDGWRPRLAPLSREADVLFLAAMDPETQADVRSQWRGRKWCALDSSGYWIEEKGEALIETIRGVDIVLMNDWEARFLTRNPMLLKAARAIMEWGPQAVVLKLGEYGCALLHEDGFFMLPGYPLEEAADPTGTGDAFAGGFLGYLDLLPDSRLTAQVLRRAAIFGSVMASYCAEDFGPRRLVGLSRHELDYRAAEFREMTHFERVRTAPRPLHVADHLPRLERPRPTPTTGAQERPGPAAGTPSYRSARRLASTGLADREASPAG